MLLVLLLAVLAFLWMLDAFFTVQVLKKKGVEKEANSLLRDIYRKNVFVFILIKFAVMLFVLFAISLLSKGYLITAESVAFIFIYIYASVDWHNYKIWKNRNNKTENNENKKQK
ncbi:MAG: DUF5658 family protein [Candidatus Aenigmatarchaeota archaeon]